jgi:4'-phosphopantetheinyl transferase
VTQIQWEPGPARPRLEADAVDVWQGDLAASAPDPRELLSAEERERSDRFVRPEDGARWARARAFLRGLLAIYIEVDPRTLRFAEGLHGKPQLAGDPGGMAGAADAPQAPQLRFNLSHSGAIALIAVALGREVGVDVELPRRAVDHVAIARRVLGEAEAQWLAALDPAAREREFLRAWVRWEAVLKYHGTGIGGAEQPHADADPWVAELPIAPPAAAALAVEGGPCVVRTWRWAPAGA